MLDPTTAIHGLAERWVARERVQGELLEIALRSGQALIAGRLNLALVKTTGEIGWRRVLGGRASILAAAIEPFGGLVAAIVEGARLELMRGALGESSGSVKLPEGCCSVALSERAERIVVGDRFGAVRYLDASGRTKDTVQIGHPAELLGVAPSGEAVIAASNSGHVTLLNAKHKPERTSYVRAQLTRAWVDARGERGFVLAAGEGVMVHSLRTSSMVTIGLDRAVADADSSALGDQVVVLAHDLSLAVLDAAARLVWRGEAPTGAVWKETADYANDIGEAFTLNEYFATRPEMMLGRMRLSGRMYRDNEPTLESDKRDLGEALAQAAARRTAHLSRGRRRLSVQHRG